MRRRKLTDEQLAEKDMLDTLRTVKRLQHRIALRRELNELETAAIEAQQAALDSGKPFKLDIRSVLSEELT